MPAVYFGPYIHCNVEQVEVVVNIRCCGNIDCENVNVQIYTNAHKYCCKCGKEIKLKGVPILQEGISKETITLLNAGDVMRLLQPEAGVHLWLSNMSEQSYYLNTDYEIKDVQNFDFTFHVNRFMEYYKSAIKELNSFYGQKNCSIRFGLLVWSD